MDIMTEEAQDLAEKAYASDLEKAIRTRRHLWVFTLCFRASAPGRRVDFLEIGADSYAWRRGPFCAVCGQDQEGDGQCPGL